jgi:hypothetical protein
MRDLDCDVFVSYATVDNGFGWVSAFVEHLKTSLNAAVGLRSEQRIWWDKTNIDEDAPLTDQIRARAAQVQTMLVLLSPGYVRSRWCAEERQAFLQARPHAIAERRLVLVDLGSLGLEGRPAELTDLRGHLFFTPGSADRVDVGQRLGFPCPLITDPSHRPFFAAIDDLARSLASRLLDQPHSPQVTPAAIPHAAIRVFVAQSTDDVADQRDQVVRYLADHFTVVPPPDEGFAGKWADWQSQVDQALGEADCFVQLLGAHPGGKIPGSQQRPALEQYTRAKAAGQRMLLWRATDPAQVSDAAFREVVASADYCQTIQEFCEAIVEAATPPPAFPTQIPGAATVDSRSIFIQAGIEDVDQADRLSAVLAEFNCFTQLPLHQGTPEEIRADLEENLDSCDGLILLYGQIPAAWLKAQFRELPRHLARRRKRPSTRSVPALAVYGGEPGGKPNPGVNAPGLHWIDITNPQARQQLTEWVATMDRGVVS